MPKRCTPFLLALKKHGGADGNRTRITWLTTKDFTVKLQPHTPPCWINIQKNPSRRKSFCVSQVDRNLRFLGFYTKHIRMISKCKQKQRTTRHVRFAFLYLCTTFSPKCRTVALQARSGSPKFDYGVPFGQNCTVVKLRTCRNVR